MAWGYTGGATNGGSGATADITHGLTINSGDLVVAYINANASGAVSNDGGGAVWTEAVNETPAGETARQALFWKVAGGSEPASYSWTLSGSAQYRVIVKVFTLSQAPVLDSSASTTTAATSTSVVVEAIDGATISDDALSIVFGGKDNREGIGNSFTSADNSYVGVLGDSGDQVTAGAHRIYTTGEIFSGNVTISGTSSINDSTYSSHIAFVEGTATLGIASEPSETRVTEQGSFTVTNPATAPTTGNTSIKLVNGSGPAATIDSVTGSDPYVINYTFPKATNKLFNAAGYVHHIDIDGETVDSSIIPFLPQTDWDFVVLGTVDTGTDIYTEYAGGTWVTNDQAVWDTVADPSGNTVTIDDTLNWDINPAPTIDQTVGIYRIAANETKDVDDTITFEDMTMAIEYIEALNNDRLNLVTARIDAGAGVGKLKIYDGTKPAVGAAITTQNLLATPLFSATSFPAASGGSMTANAITSQNAVADGTATWFRCTDSDDNVVLDGDIADLNLNTTNITLGLEVAVTSAIITAGN